MSNLGSKCTRHNESHYELLISHPLPAADPIRLAKIANTVCVWRGACCVLEEESLPYLLSNQILVHRVTALLGSELLCSVSS